VQPPQRQPPALVGAGSPVLGGAGGGQPVPRQEHLSHSAERGRINVRGDDRHQRGVAGGGVGFRCSQPAWLAHAGRCPGGLGLRRAWQAA
jgi:hypothetical protein